MLRQTKQIKKFLNDEGGQGLIEYALILAFVGLASAGLLMNAGGSVGGIWTSAQSTLVAGAGLSGGTQLASQTSGNGSGSNGVGGVVISNGNGGNGGNGFNGNGFNGKGFNGNGNGNHGGNGRGFGGNGNGGNGNGGRNGNGRVF